MNYYVAILGTGKVAEEHIKCHFKSSLLHPTIIFGSNRERINQLADKYNLKIAKDLSEVLLDKKIRVVDICTSNERHYIYAKEALVSGKAIIVEKPAAQKYSDVKELAELASLKNIPALICFQKRFNASYQRLQKILSKNNLGNFICGESTIQMPRSKEYYKNIRRGQKKYAGGGVLTYHAIHDLDLICQILGKVENIDGKLSREFHHEIDVEDTANFTLNFTNGSHHTFFASTNPKLPAKIEHHLFFDKGVFSFNDYQCYLSHEKRKLIDKVSSNSLFGKIALKFYYRLGSFKYILKDLERALKIHTPTLCDLKGSLECHRLIEDLSQSAQD